MCGASLRTWLETHMLPYAETKRCSYTKWQHSTHIHISELVLSRKQDIMPTWSDQDIVPFQAQDICTQHKILLPLISEQCSYPKQDIGPAQNITLLSVKLKLSLFNNITLCRRKSDRHQNQSKSTSVAHGQLCTPSTTHTWTSFYQTSKIAKQRAGVCLRIWQTKRTLRRWCTMSPSHDSITP